MLIHKLVCEGSTNESLSWNQVEPLKSCPQALVLVSWAFEQRDKWCFQCQDERHVTKSQSAQSTSSLPQKWTGKFRTNSHLFLNALCSKGAMQKATSTHSAVLQGPASVHMWWRRLQIWENLSFYSSINQLSESPTHIYFLTTRESEQPHMGSYAWKGCAWIFLSLIVCNIFQLLSSSWTVRAHSYTAHLTKMESSTGKSLPIWVMCIFHYFIIEFGIQKLTIFKKIF